MTALLNRVSCLSLLLVVQLLAGAGCNKPAAAPTMPAPQPQSLPTTPMHIGSQLFVLEIAPDDKTRRMGLMFRDSMAADRGMIFVFPGEEVLDFYMRDTHIPLDIIYLDHAGKVVSVKQMKPYDLTTVSSDAPAQYAIELNEGATKGTGVKVGDTVRIPPEIRATDR